MKRYLIFICILFFLSCPGNAGIERSATLEIINGDITEWFEFGAPENPTMVMVLDGKYCSLHEFPFLTIEAFQKIIIGFEWEGDEIEMIYIFRWAMPTVHQYEAKLTDGETTKLYLDTN